MEFGGESLSRRHHRPVLASDAISDDSLLGSDSSLYNEKAGLDDLPSPFSADVSVKISLRRINKLGLDFLKCFFRCLEHGILAGLFMGIILSS